MVTLTDSFAINYFNVINLQSKDITILYYHGIDAEGVSGN